MSLQSRIPFADLIVGEGTSEAPAAIDLDDLTAC